MTIIKKRLDSDTYLVTSELDKRKEFVVYRGRLKILGESPMTPKENASKGEIKGDEEGRANEAIVENSPLETPHYKLRKRTDTDYRKYFT